MSMIAKELSRLSRRLTLVKENFIHFEEELQRLETVVAAGPIGKPSLDREDIIFIEEMAEMFGRSVPTLRRWMKAGRLQPFYQEGRKYYWLKSELPQVLKSNATIED